MKFQIECANAFRDWWADNLLAERHCDTLMKMAWGYIKTNMNTAVEDELSNDESVTVSYVKAWEELFIALNEYITDEWVTTEVIPTIKSLIDLKHKVAVRKHGVNLLIQAVLKYDEKSVLDYFKSLLLYWWHDLNWNIRYAIWEGFPSIAKSLSKDNCMDIFYPELAEFLNDVEILVRLTAIEATLEIFDMLETEHIKDDFIPVVIQHLNLDIDETCNSRMSKVIGKITFNLLNFSEVTSELNDALLSYFKGLVEIDALEIVQNVWFNLPGMYFIFNKGELDFAEILEKYVSHKDQGIRHLVAKSFHEIVGISGMDKAKALEFKDMFFTLLSDADPEIRKTMINNLDDIVMNFLSVMGEEEIEVTKAEDGSETESKRSEFIHELLSNLVQVGGTIAIQNPFVAKPKAKGAKVQFPTNSSWWRMRLVFYEKLWCLFDVFPQDSLKQAFFEAARFDFLNGAEPLRKRWVVLLAKMIYSELFEEERQEMLTRLVDELEEGTFVQRRCLLEFYEGSIQVFSKRYWHKQCYKGFMKFAHDKIPVMRVKFSKCAQNIFTKNLTKIDTEFDFIDVVDALLEDIDDDVQESGVQLNTIIMKGFDKSKEEELEEEEKTKLTFEKALKEREKREREEIEKRREEEKEKEKYMTALTNQLRMKKRYLKLPGIQAKPFGKETSNSKTRSRKRGSFTIGHRSKTSKASKKHSISSTHSAKAGSSTPTGNNNGILS